ESVRLIRHQGVDGEVVTLFEYLYICFAVISFLKHTYTYASNVVKAFPSLPRKWGAAVKVLYILFGRFWDFLDFLVGILGICSVFAYFLREHHINRALDNFAANNGNEYINLSKQRNLELMFTFCVGGVVFFVSCKMIQILR
ncbi:unnamed protein product, partial [Strongylus vulgaris]